jgi:GNAT superfamily N-acetyltransferase
VQASYNLDPEWSGCSAHITATVLPGSIKTLAKEPTCLFVQHGNRVIAASIYDPEPEPGGVHLVTGPCVLIEYRNRGIGGALLGATLEALRERGISEVIGHTRPKSASARYLCTKFGGKEAATEPALPDESRADAA